MSTTAITLHRAPNRRNRSAPRRVAAQFALLGAWWAMLHTSALAQIGAPPSETLAPQSNLISNNPGETDPSYERLVLSALNAYERGQWAKALQEFEQAHRLQPSARTLRTIGMSAYNLGDFPKAISALEQAERDSRRPLDAEHRSQVRQLIGRAYREVARVDLLSDPTPDEVRVDGALPKRGLNGSLLLMPGQHELTVTKAGYRSVQYPIAAGAGQHSQVTIHMPPLPGAAAAARRANPSPYDGAAALPEWQRTAGIVGLAVGATGLMASGITAALALDRRSELGKSCPNGACPPDQHGELAVYNRFKTVSTITFYGGLLAGAAGITLLLIGPQGDDDVADGDHLTLQGNPSGLWLRGTL